MKLKKFLLEKFSIFLILVFANTIRYGRRINKSECFPKLKECIKIDKHFCILGVINQKVICYPYSKLLNPRVLMLAIAISTDSHKNKIFLLNYGDSSTYSSAAVSFFVFCKDKNIGGQILIPDPEAYFDDSNLLELILQKGKESDFGARKSIGYWRGATTGGDFNADSWSFYPRSILVALSLKYTEIIDAKFTRLVQGAVLGKNGLSEIYLAPESSPYEVLKYKFLIDVDGNSNSWSRLRQLLVSGGVVLKQESKYEQWYYKALKSNENCIIFRKDFSDLIEKISHLEANEADCIRIVKNQYQLFEDFLRPQAARNYLSDVIDKYGLDV